MRSCLGDYACVAVATILSAALVVGTADGMGADNSRFRGRDFRRQLGQPIGVVWSEVPLRDALNNLAGSQNVAIWLDRRIDPGRHVSLAADEIPLRDVLARLAHDEGLGMVFFRSVVYLGPPAAAGRLRTLGELRREEARRLPPTAVKRLFTAKPMHWEDLATPRELLATLASEGGLEIADADRVVHDLWPAAGLPSLALVDRLTLILAPLELTFQLEDHGSRIRLIPIPDRVALIRRYPAGLRPEDVARRWSRSLPESRVRIEGDSIVVEGPIEDQERLTEWRRPTDQRTAPPGKHAGANLDDVRILQPKFEDLRLERAIRQMAAQLKLQLVFDADGLRRSGIDLDQRISVELKGEVTIDELFRAVLEPVGLTFDRRGSTIEIRAARP